MRTATFKLLSITNPEHRQAISLSEARGLPAVHLDEFGRINSRMREIRSSFFGPQDVDIFGDGSLYLFNRKPDVDHVAPGTELSASMSDLGWCPSVKALYRNALRVFRAGEGSRLDVRVVSIKTGRGVRFTCRLEFDRKGEIVAWVFKPHVWLPVFVASLRITND